MRFPGHNRRLNGFWWSRSNRTWRIFDPLNALTSLRYLAALLGSIACFVTGCFTPFNNATTWTASDGKPVDPFRMNQERATVFVFVRTDCPISNHYAPEVERLFSTYRSQGIAFWLVYADADTTGEDIMPAIHDPDLRLVKKAGVKVTPEVAVFLKSGREIYRGRVDDRYADLGKERPEASEHDLEDAIKAVLTGKPVEKRKRAVGCYIPQ